MTFGVLALTLCVAAPARALDGDAGVEDPETSDVQAQAPHAEWTTRPLFVHVELHGAFLSDGPDESLLSGRFGYAVEVGHRWGAWGLFGRIEHNLWVGLEVNPGVAMGAVNLAVGVERLHAEGFARTAIAVGTSILAFQTALDEPGEVGLFADVRPFGVRVEVAPEVVVGIDPIHFSMVAPVMGGIPLVDIQYRSTLYVEARF